MQMIYIDPAYRAYYKDRLFDEHDPVLNRDDTLVPFIRMQAALSAQGVTVHTADFLFEGAAAHRGPADYYSFGMLENYASLATRADIKLRAFVIFEPPVVAPALYRELPALTAAFERVYVHNVVGDGYSLEGVNQQKLRKLYWPQPKTDVLAEIWQQGSRLRRMVVINGNHKPVSHAGELYSKRIEVMAQLADINVVDLYGRGWERWWSRNAMWLPYWRHRKTLMSIYKGACESKYTVLGGYDFALCFENMTMQGYVTEKIFDCLYAGTIPVYLGASDIASLIPEACYVDYRNYSSPQEMWRHLQEMPVSEVAIMREAGREFIQSIDYHKYFNFVQGIVIV
ncbi:glycosyltransferase family 10 domain-containing protein [Leeia sp.]|uniref:glycosyltransferase family 10 domain-containing protein n=1 Tax=Leeia sp. TaxID=2884678 RepID=UPI0035B15C9C